MHASATRTSVVIPAFNAARTLAATLESVAAQTEPAAEIVVVDDGSSDETAALARSFAVRLPQLLVISLPVNGGLSHARNVGIANSTCPLVAPLDADDVCHPRYLEKMGAALAAAPDAGFAYCFFRKIDLAGRLLPDRRHYRVSGWAFYQMLEKNYVGSGSNAVYRRRLLEAVGGFELQLRGSEDRMLQLLCAWQAPVVCVPEHLIGYRNVPGSVSKQRLLMEDNSVRLPVLLRAALPDIEPRALRRAISQRHFRWSSVAIRWKHGSLASIVRHFAIGFAHDPVGVGAALAVKLLGSLKRPWQADRGSAPQPTVAFADADPARLSAPIDTRGLRAAARRDEAHGRRMSGRSPATLVAIGREMLGGHS